MAVGMLLADGSLLCMADIYSEGQSLWEKQRREGIGVVSLTQSPPTYVVSDLHIRPDSLWVRLAGVH